MIVYFPFLLFAAGTLVAYGSTDMELRIGRMGAQHHALSEVEQIVHQCSFS